MNVRTHSVKIGQHRYITCCQNLCTPSLETIPNGRSRIAQDATLRWKGDTEMEKALNPYSLVAYDPGLTIGVAYLGTDTLKAFETKNFEQAMRLEADFYGVEDFTPYRSKKFRISGSGVVTIKQIGVIEYIKPNSHLIWRSTICAMITGMSNAPKKAVQRSTIELLEGLGISLKMGSHALDAVACILTLGTIIVQNGGTVGVTDRWTELFQHLATRKRPSLGSSSMSSVMD